MARRGAAAAPAPSPFSRLSEDEARKMAEAMASPLEPQHLLRFAATSHFIHIAVAGEVGDLREPHLAVRALCRKMGTSYAEACRAVALEWYRKDLTDEDAAVAALVIRHSSRLKMLNFNNNNIGAAGVAPIGDALKGNKRLEYLHLNCNPIGDPGATAIGEALKVNRVLRHLSLTECRVGDPGAIAMGEGLKVNKGLKMLYIYRNQIGDAGATALAAGVKVNTVLEILSAFENRVGDAGAAALAEAMKKNTSVTNLYLYNNSFSEAARQALRGSCGAQVNSLCL